MIPSHPSMHMCLLVADTTITCWKCLQLQSDREIAVYGHGTARSPALSARQTVAAYQECDHRTLCPPHRHVGARMARSGQIGRASCRVRVCQYVEISVGAVSFKKKTIR